MKLPLLEINDHFSIKIEVSNKTKFMFEIISDYIGPYTNIVPGEYYPWYSGTVLLKIIRHGAVLIGCTVIGKYLYQFDKRKRHNSKLPLSCSHCLSALILIGIAQLLSIFSIWFPLYAIENFSCLPISLYVFYLFFNLLKSIDSQPIASENKDIMDRKLHKEMAKRQIIQQLLVEKTTNLEFYSDCLEQLYELNIHTYTSKKEIVQRYLEAGCHLMSMETGIVGKMRDGQIHIIGTYGDNSPLIKKHQMKVDPEFFEGLFLKNQVVFLTENDLEKGSDSHSFSTYNFRAGLFIKLEEGAQGFDKILYFYTTKRKHWSNLTYQKAVMKLLAGGLMKKIHLHSIQHELKRERKLLRKGEAVSNTCSWVYNVNSHRLDFSPELLNIFDIQKYTIGSDQIFEEMLNMVEKAKAEEIHQTISLAKKSLAPWSMEFEILSASGKKKWIRMEGAEWLGTDRVLGIIQDTTATKKTTQQLRQSVSIITDQNKRLIHFTYVVSHNLKSHIGNIGSLINLFEITEKPELQKEIRNKLKCAYQHLMDTITQLNEVVKSPNKLDLQTESLLLKDILDRVLVILEREIYLKRAQITHDFNDVDKVDFVSVYLESILQNLISNAIKYAHPNRPPVIHVGTQRKDGKTILIVKDNGIGIDLKKYGSKVFNLYSTFHHHPEAQGIGLFLIKSQIESLGGSIWVESEVNVGTTFFMEFPKLYEKVEVSYQLNN